MARGHVQNVWMPATKRKKASTSDAADRLREEMRRVKLTQQRVKDETGISQDRVSRFIRERSLEAPDLVAFCRLLASSGVDLGFVFTGERGVETRAETVRLNAELSELLAQLRANVGPGPGGK